MDDTPMLVGQSPAPAAAPPVAVASFDGHSKVLLRLCLKNALLNLVTLFLYRFWAKTHLRRYFWGNTCFCGDYLEYTGTGVELCKGFFIAAVVIAVILAATTALKFAAQAAGITEVMPLVDLLQIAAFSCLWFVAIHRAWRYRLSRTRFRGVGMHLDGRTRDFLWVAIKAGVLVALTLGIAQPVMAVRLSREIIGNTYLGQSRFSLEAVHGRDLIGLWMRHWLIMAACFVTAIVAFAMAPAAGLFAVIAAILIGFGSFLYYRLIEVRYILDGIDFGEARFTSTSDAGTCKTIISLYLASLAAVAFGMLLGLALVILHGELSADALGVLAAELGMQRLVALGIAFFLVLLLVVFPILKAMLFELPLARHFLATLSVTNPEAFAQAVQDPAAKEPRQGEGMADLLGIDGI